MSRPSIRRAHRCRSSRSIRTLRCEGRCWDGEAGEGVLLTVVGQEEKVVGLVLSGVSGTYRGGSCAWVDSGSAVYMYHSRLYIPKIGPAGNPLDHGGHVSVATATTLGPVCLVSGITAV
jgi:hypothetical protein